MWATLIVHPHHISSLKLMHMDHIDCVSKKLMCARVIYFMLLWMSCDYIWLTHCLYLAISMAQSTIRDRLLFFAIHPEGFT